MLLASRIPAPLGPLARVAYNYRWSWLPGGPELFRSVDPHRWELCGENPVRLLEEASAGALAQRGRHAPERQPREGVQAAYRAFDPEVLTIGFARRIARCGSASQPAPRRDRDEARTDISGLSGGSTT